MLQSLLQNYAHHHLLTSIDLYEQNMKLSQSGKLLDDLQETTKRAIHVSKSSEELACSVVDVAESTSKMAQFTEETTGKAYNKVLPQCIELWTPFGVSLIRHIYWR
ncbi:hypothetical protein JNUCC42_12285 [Brevibacterium sp. JNUCC-42]|nr:hypothetical protein JNUCC42_12285 [Brevibacterium sp. JNUCC-42]